LSQPLVSVIVVVYNGEHYLAEALDSLFEQDYDLVEGIVIDDGSTDRSGDIARSYPVRYVRQENRGAPSARNRGIAESRGDLIAFLDADDVLPESKVGVQARYLVAHPEIGCVLGRQELFFDGLEPPQWLERDQIFGDLEGVPLLAAMFRRSVLEQLGGFDETYLFAPDRDLFIRMREQGVEIAVLEDFVLKRSFHGDNQTFNPPASPPILRSLREKLERGRVVTNSPPEAT
jgi:glycosyltransferase involved in cell wall biosynthesis